MVENMCTLALPRHQVTTYQQGINHRSVSFPSPPYSALPFTLSKFAAFSDNYQPHVNNESAFSVIPEQPLNRACADPQQQLNWSWSVNLHGNSGQWLAPTTHATTNIATFLEPSTISPCQTLSPMSPTRPSQPQQHGQSVLSMGTGYAAREKHHCVCMSDTCPNPANSVNGVRNLDQAEKEKQHICYYPGCGKTFEKSSRLLVHQRRHRNKRLHICNWSSCGKRFFTPSDLRRHICIHTDERKYVCKVCSKKFLRSDHLSLHVKTHLKKAGQFWEKQSAATIAAAVAHLSNNFIKYDQ